MHLHKRVASKHKLLPPMTERSPLRDYGYYFVMHSLIFFKLIGDMSSQTILSKTVKVRVHPSIDPITIANQAGYKLGLKYTLLHDANGNAVLGVNKTSVPFPRKWKDLKNCKQFLSTIPMMHTNHG